jgi:hypothetical protein
VTQTWRRSLSVCSGNRSIIAEFGIRGPSSPLPLELLPSEATTATSFPPDHVENLLPAGALLILERREPAHHPFMNIHALVVRILGE